MVIGSLGRTGFAAKGEAGKPMARRIGIRNACNFNPYLSQEEATNSAAV